MKVRLLTLFLLLATLLPIGFAQTTSSYYHKFYDLESKSGWGPGYALLSPSWSICSSCSSSASTVNWYRATGISSPSQDGNATKQHIGGTRPYSDILWNNHLVGSFSSVGLPDYNHTLTSGARNFIYDVYFYANNIGYSQALEFDINQFTGGKGYIWGHECRIAGGHEWDIYSNTLKKWVPTGVPCWPKNNAWNHLVIQVQRTSGGNLLFKSITFNGTTHTLNIIKAPGSTSWNGITINYQQDGDSSMHAYSIFLDKLNFTMW
jgi:hypothetical protein